MPRSRKVLQRRVNVRVEVLTVSCIKSTGMKSSEFCEKLIYSKKVAVVPGSAFGESGEGYVRVSYAYSVQHVTTALQRIKEFVEELKK